jgi:hypothetical protein
LFFADREGCHQRWNPSDLVIVAGRAGDQPDHVVRMEATGSVWVQVVDVDRKPIRNLREGKVQIHIQAAEGPVVGSWGGSSIVGTNGVCVFEGVPPGQYRVSGRPEEVPRVEPWTFRRTTQSPVVRAKTPPLISKHLGRLKPFRLSRFWGLIPNPRFLSTLCTTVHCSALFPLLPTFWRSPRCKVAQPVITTVLTLTALDPKSTSAHERSRRTTRAPGQSWG